VSTDVGDMERPGYREVIMDTTISAPVQQISRYSNPSANQKRSSDKVTNAPEEHKEPSEMRGKDADTGSENVDTVDLTTTRMVSQSNQAAAENEVEDIDAVAKRILEVRQWLESEYESAQIEQVHQLNANNLVEILS